MKQSEREVMWEQVVDMYKRLVTGNRLIKTDSQNHFIREVNKHCFGRVYMHQPSDHMINKLYQITTTLVV